MAREPKRTKAMDRAVNPAVKLLAKMIVDEVNEGKIEPTDHDVANMTIEAIESTPQYDKHMWPLLNSNDDFERERQEIWHDWCNEVRNKAARLAEQELGTTFS